MYRYRAAAAAVPFGCWVLGPLSAILDGCYPNYPSIPLPAIEGGGPLVLCRSMRDACGVFWAKFFGFS